MLKDESLFKKLVFGIILQITLLKWRNIKNFRILA